MAFYLYRCNKCGVGQDVEFPMSAKRPSSIPCDCGGEMMRLWVTPPPVHFKGGGFPGDDMKRKRQYAKEQDANERAQKVKKPWEVR